MVARRARQSLFALLVLLAAGPAMAALVESFDNCDGALIDNAQQSVTGNRLPDRPDACRRFQKT